jgi:hypothetical protein
MADIHDVDTTAAHLSVLSQVEQHIDVIQGS